jgi:hypothetical protein
MIGFIFITLKSSGFFEKVYFVSYNLFDRMAENDEDVWRKLSSFDKVCHKNWKARKAGYEELLKEIPTYALGTKTLQNTFEH